MAENNKNAAGTTPPAAQPEPAAQSEPMVQVSAKLLADIQTRMLAAETKAEAAMAAASAAQEAATGDDTIGSPKIREGKTFEPSFRTVRLRKYPIKGDVTDMGYITGWTSRGAYQQVDRTGANPVMVDFLDVIFLGHERDAKGVMQAESIRLLDLLNRSEQVHCKVLSQKTTPRKVSTNEEIDITVFDPAHGLTATGDKIDGYSAFTDVEFTLEVPGLTTPVEVDGMYVN